MVEELLLDWLALDLQKTGDAVVINYQSELDAIGKLENTRKGKAGGVDVVFIHLLTKTHTPPRQQWHGSSVSKACDQDHS